MKKPIIPVLAFILIACGITGCGDDKPAPVKENILLKKQAETLGKAENAANDLLKRQNEALQSAEQ